MTDKEIIDSGVVSWIIGGGINVSDEYTFRNKENNKHIATGIIEKGKRVGSYNTNKILVVVTPYFENIHGRQSFLIEIDRLSKESQNKILSSIFCISSK